MNLSLNPLVIRERFIQTGEVLDAELINRVRVLRKEASAIGKQLDELFFRTNKAWALFYDYVDKT